MNYIVMDYCDNGMIDTAYGPYTLEQAKENLIKLCEKRNTIPPEDIDNSTLESNSETIEPSNISTSSENVSEDVSDDVLPMEKGDSFKISEDGMNMYMSWIDDSPIVMAQILPLNNLT